jgi:hypothetical protein
MESCRCFTLTLAHQFLKRKKQIKQYKAICLLMFIFKIFTKVGTNRLIGIVHKVIRSTQKTFMPCRHILEGDLSS